MASDYSTLRHLGQAQDFNTVPLRMGARFVVADGHTLSSRAVPVPRVPFAPTGQVLLRTPARDRPGNVVGDIGRGLVVEVAAAPEELVVQLRSSVGVAERL